MTDANSGAKLEAIGFALVVTGLFARVFFSASTASPNQRNLVILLCLGGAAILALASAQAGKKPALLRSPLGMAALVLMTVVTLLSPYEAESLHGLLERFGLLLAAVFLPDTLFDPRRRAQLLASVLGAVLLTLALGLAQTTYLFDVLRELAPAQSARPDLLPFLESNRARGTYGQANAFAGAIAMCLPFVVVWYLSDPARSGRRRAIICLAVMACALWASASRGGTWACLCGLGALALNKPGPERWAPKSQISRFVLWIAALGAGGGLLVWGLVMTGIWDLEGSSFFQTLDFRRDYAAMASRAFLDRPGAGQGFLMLGEVAARFQREGEAFSRLAHNGYLSTVAETGFIGLLGLLLLVVAGLKRREAPEGAIPVGSPPSLWLPLAGGLALSAWGGDLLFFVGVDGALHRPLNGLLVLGLGALCVGFVGLPAAKCLLAAPKALSAAARASAIAFLAHALVDTHFYNLNLLALLVLLQIVAFQSPRPSRGSPLLSSALAVGILALALVWLNISAPYVKSAPLLARERAASGTPLPGKLRATITRQALEAAEHDPFHLDSLGRAVDALALSRNPDAIRRAYALCERRATILERLPAYRRRYRALAWAVRSMSLPDVAVKSEFFREFERRYR